MKPSALKLQPVVAGLSSVVFIAFGVLNIALGTWFAYQDKLSMAGLQLGGGIILMFAGNIGQFEVLKWFGLEAKTKLDQVSVALEETKRLALVNGKALVELYVQIGGRGNAWSFSELWGRVEQVRKSLVALECSRDDISEVLQPWIRLVIRSVVGTFQGEQIPRITLNRQAKGLQTDEAFGQAINMWRDRVWRLMPNRHIAPDLAERLREAFREPPCATQEEAAAVYQEAMWYVDKLDRLMRTHELEDAGSWLDRMSPHGDM